LKLLKGTSDSLLADVAITSFVPFEVRFHERSVAGFEMIDSIDVDSVCGDYVGHVPDRVRSSFEWKTEFEPCGSERQVANEAIRG
jgi:hypothetical protein